MNSKLTDFFAQVYVINLVSRPDRQLDMRSQLKKMSLSGHEPNLHWYAAVKPTEAAGFPSAGARGCFMSHLAVLKLAQAAQAQSVLILEDDLNFFDDAPKNLASVVNFLSGHDWGMFHGVYRLPTKPVARDAICFEASPELAVATTSMVAISGPWIARLVEYLEAILKRPPGDPKGGPMHVDGAYCWFRRAHPEMHTFLASKPLGYQRSSRTDVHALKWWDRLAWLALPIGAVRRLRNLLR